MRGGVPIPIAKGVIVDFGLGKASLRVDLYGDAQVEVDDIVILTGKEKTIKRPEGPRFGEIQEISDETIVTSLGTSDDISPGDIFLIQRNEPVIDPDTKEIIGTNSINVGRYSVDTVRDESSVARVIEQNLAPLKTDIVYKESEYLDYLAMLQSDSLKISRLERDVSVLREQLNAVNVRLNNMERSQSDHLNEYETLKKDIESVLTKLMSGDLGEVRLNVRDNEPFNPPASGQLLAVYEQALRDCLDNKFESSVRQFNVIISQYPDSPLTENCRYWIAQSYFSMKAYPQAIEGFLSVIRDARFDHKDDDASIMLGITFFRMNRTEEARTEFERFISAYPDSEYRNKVNYWISRLPS